MQKICQAEGMFGAQQGCSAGVRGGGREAKRQAVCRWWELRVMSQAEADSQVCSSGEPVPWEG